jgi:uncharacterized membrane protein
MTNLRKISLTVFIVLCILCLAQGIYYYPLLPDKIASHFGVSGQPNDWSSKTSFITFYYIITAVMILIFLGLRFGISKIPVSMINMPNKEYWLSPEKKQETFDFMSHYSMWFGSATLLLLLYMFNQSFQVSLGRAKSLSHPALATGIYIAFMALWMTGMIRRFSKNGE